MGFHSYRKIGTYCKWRLDTIVLIPKLNINACLLFIINEFKQSAVFFQNTHCNINQIETVFLGFLDAWLILSCVLGVRKPQGLCVKAF